MSLSLSLNLFTKYSKMFVNYVLTLSNQNNCYKIFLMYNNNTQDPKIIILIVN